MHVFQVGFVSKARHLIQIGITSCILRVGQSHVVTTAVLQSHHQPGGEGESNVYGQEAKEESSQSRSVGEIALIVHDNSGLTYDKTKAIPVGYRGLSEPKKVWGVMMLTTQ